MLDLYESSERRMSGWFDWEVLTSIQVNRFPGVRAAPGYYNSCFFEEGREGEFLELLSSTTDKQLQEEQLELGMPKRFSRRVWNLQRASRK